MPHKTTRRNALIAAGGLLTGYGLKSTSLASGQSGTQSDIKVETGIPYLDHGDITLKLDVYRPTFKDKFPVFLFVHGGGWQNGDKNKIGADTYGNMAQDFASRGFGLVSVNYRLAPTYTYPDAPRDIAFALNWIYNNRVKYGFDPERVVMGGFSAGGHLSSLVASYSTFYGFDIGCPGYKPVNAVIPIDGCYDPDGSTHSGLDDFFGGTYTNKTETWEEGSTANHITEDHPPVLIFHAQDDTGLDYSQALAYRDTLESNGVTYEMVNPATGGHTFYREGEWQTKSVDHWEDFLNRHL